MCENWGMQWCYVMSWLQIVNFTRFRITRGLAHIWNWIYLHRRAPLMRSCRDFQWSAVSRRCWSVLFIKARIRSCCCRWQRKYRDANGSWLVLDVSHCHMLWIHRLQVVIFLHNVREVDGHNKNHCVFHLHFVFISIQTQLTLMGYSDPDTMRRRRYIYLIEACVYCSCTYTYVAWICTIKPKQ